MSVPGIVESRLGEEEIATRVSLSGGDEVFVTPTRTLVYRAEGLLSDESVESFDHDADRLSISEGRRKSTITYEHAVDGQRELKVPSSRLTDVLQPVLAGMLRAKGVTDPDERIAQAYRFSELTLVITSERLLKHVGNAVWDADYESYHFEDVTGIDYEQGSVATQIVMDVDGRTQRIKTPNEEFAAVRQQLDQAIFAYHNVSSAEELAEKAGEDGDDGDDDEAERVDATDAVVSMGQGVDPLSTGGDDEEPLGEDPLADPGESGAGDEVGDPAAENVDAQGDDGGSDDEGSDDADGSESDVAGGSDAEVAEASDGAVETTDPDGTDVETADSAGADAGADVETADSAGADADDADEDATDTDDSPVDPEDADEEVIAEWESPPDESGSFGGGFEPAGGDAETSVADELADLREVVERQNELLAEQQRTIEQLVETLREREE